MITRIWHGKIKTTQERMYTQYITDTGIKDYLNTAGNMGVQILQKTEGDITHMYTITQWKDMKSIEAFAGKDVEKAKYYEEDEKYYWMPKTMLRIIKVTLFPIPKSTAISASLNNYTVAEAGRMKALKQSCRIQLKKQLLCDLCRACIPLPK